MLWEKKREKRALCPVERFDAPQRPDKPAPKEWENCRIAPLSGGAPSLPAGFFVSISTSP